ncbi:MAG: alkylmercury lyase family protein [Thermoanaerobaculia bacterium]
MDDSSLHHAIISHFLIHLRPPTIRELASHFHCDEAAVRNALRVLAEHHGVVLHPMSDEVWIAHPFSAAPTTCVVSAGNRKWWGNCAWCSFGVAHLAGGSATIETRLGAIGDSVTIRIEDGRLLDTSFVVHFPVPMRHAWDNGVFTCSVQLLFRDEAEVDEWCRVRGIPKGDVRPIEQVWTFAREWYGRHADADWTKWSMREAAEIFRRHNLTGATWTLGNESERF